MTREERIKLKAIKCEEQMIRLEELQQEQIRAFKQLRFWIDLMKQGLEHSDVAHCKYSPTKPVYDLVKKKFLSPYHEGDTPLTAKEVELNDGLYDMEEHVVLVKRMEKGWRHFGGVYNVVVLKNGEERVLMPAIDVPPGRNPEKFSGPEIPGIAQKKATGNSF